MKFLYRVSFFCTLLVMGYFMFRFGEVFTPEIISKIEGQTKEESVFENTEIASNIVIKEEKKLPVNVKKSEDHNLDALDKASETAIETVTKEASVTSDTQFFVLKVDESTGLNQEIMETIPDQYIGKTRVEIEEILANYSNAPSLKDLEKGFLSASLTSFSKDKIVVTKTYFADLQNQHFYIVVENEYLTVYYSDMTTVYLYTDVLFSNLSNELQQEILDKKYVETEEELYNFLESYTS